MNTIARSPEYLPTLEQLWLADILGRRSNDPIYDLIRGPYYQFAVARGPSTGGSHRLGYAEAMSSK